MLRGLRMSLGVCITMVIAFCIICPRLKGTRVAQSNWNTQHVPLLVCIPDTLWTCRGRGAVQPLREAGEEFWPGCGRDVRGASVLLVSQRPCVHAGILECRATCHITRPWQAWVDSSKESLRSQAADFTMHRQELQSG